MGNHDSVKAVVKGYCWLYISVAHYFTSSVYLWLY